MIKHIYYIELEVSDASGKYIIYRPFEAEYPSQACKQGKLMEVLNLSSTISFRFVRVHSTSRILEKIKLAHLLLVQAFFLTP